MDDRTKAPYIPQDFEQVAKVIGELNTHAKKGRGKSGGFTIKKKTYTISDGSGRLVDSWQCQDWDYKKPGLPTYARGLFTHSNNRHPEIAVRGYDKFFNTDEVIQTRWANVEQNTRGPYELSVKENGCIIFIAGLDDDTLLVTSKHSTGARQDASANHAFAGEAWLDKHLAAVGKTRADLAKRLRSMNATAVAELCDDQFEEHVLEYTPDQAGLYLHGVNLNLPNFVTYPGNLVAAFAEEWGLRKTMYVMKETIQEVKTFLEDVAQTGNYDGRDTEGFVIRCQARDSPGAPYHDWFFKYKFEEPYLMYRQWREVTRAVIAGKQPKFRKHKQVTEEYIFYARQQLVKDPSIGKAFNNNHGIIKMRNGFLEQKGMRGDEIIRQEQESGEASVSHGVVLCPAATIGCGKTTVALALVKLFGWGHEQNDNIQGKGNRPRRFAQAVINSLVTHSVVIADRNNHQRREREQIIKDITAVVPDATFVALHWVHDRGNYDEIRKTMQDRVLSRGDNHQTIHSASKDQSEIVGIMDGFLGRFEPVNAEKAPDDGFHLVIDLDVTADSRANLQTIVQSIHNEYPNLFKMPTDGQMDEAFQWALDYKPDVKHDLSRTFAGDGKSKKEQKQAVKQQVIGAVKVPKQEFFCISLPAVRINAILEAVFKELPQDDQKFWKSLKATRRVQPSFHVTLIHKSAGQQNVYWQRLVGEWQEAFTRGKENHGYDPAPSNVELGRARVQLEYVVWDSRVMGILARLPDAGLPGGYPSTNQYAHVTIGTASESIKPKETNDLMTAWHNGSNKSIQDTKIKGSVLLEGPVKAVMSR